MKLILLKILVQKKFLIGLRKKLFYCFLINNAGFGGFGAFEDYTLEYLEKMIDLNIKATTRITHYFIPELKKNSPSFILTMQV